MTYVDFFFIYWEGGGVVMQLDVFRVIQIFDMYHKFLLGLASIDGSLHGCKGQSESVSLSLLFFSWVAAYLKVDSV